MKKLIDYFRESYAELRSVTWPTRLQTIHYTVLVVIISLLVAAFLGILDYFFGQGLQKYLGTGQDVPQAQQIEVGEDGVIQGDVDGDGNDVVGDDVIDAGDITIEALPEEDVTDVLQDSSPEDVTPEAPLQDVSTDVAPDLQPTP